MISLPTLTVTKRYLRTTYQVLTEYDFLTHSDYRFDIHPSVQEVLTEYDFLTHSDSMEHLEELNLIVLTEYDFLTHSDSSLYWISVQKQGS